MRRKLKKLELSSQGTKKEMWERLSQATASEEGLQAARAKWGRQRKRTEKFWRESLRENFASIVAWGEEQVNVRAPMELDAAASEWPKLIDAEAENRFAAVYTCNLCHASPLFVTRGLFRGAARILLPGGGLFIYGPFKVDGKHTAESNEAFDKLLRSENSEWGVRNVNDLERIGSENGLRLAERINMPSNNFLLYFVREAVEQPEAL